MTLNVKVFAKYLMMVDSIRILQDQTDSGEYIPCNDEICPFIDESDFGAQIFKDVATIRELSPEGTPVNLDKLQYTVTERLIDDRITTNDLCPIVGFSQVYSRKKSQLIVEFPGLYVSIMWEIVRELYILVK